MNIKQILGAAALFVSTLAQAGTITKAPDLGAYWNPLSNSGTYVYANSFVADSSGAVTGMGTWLLSQGGLGSDVRFVVLGSIGGAPAAGPDTANVFAQTATLAGQDYASLDYVDGGAITSLMDLVAGETYWFAATTVGMGGGSGQYQVGGHTQNSAGIVDNGTFWYSNDPSGTSFDGRNLNVEMAFSVTIGGNSNHVPEPAALALVGLALAGAAAASRRSKR